jgi:Tn7-like transposition protein D/TniQ
MCPVPDDAAGGRNDTATKRELFGAGHVISIRLSKRLKYLVGQLPPAVALTVDDLIDHHTLAPSMRPFLTEFRMTELRQRLSQDDLPRKGAPYDRKQRLKYCAACAEDDRKLYKEAYWHRLHQSSLIDVCPVHRCWLSYVSGIEDPELTLVAAEEVIPMSQYVAKIEPDNPQHQMSLWLAQQVKWLLDNPEVPITSANLAPAYEQRLNEIGLVTVRRRFDYARIREEFHRAMQPLIGDFKITCANYHLKARRSFCRAFRNFDGEPGLHLYLMKFLEIDVSSLPGKNGRFHFEAGPWPCLNRACTLYGQSIVTQYTMKTDHHGVSIGSFECECGYKYCRQAPDVDGLSRNRPHKIVSTEPSWNALLANLWMDKQWTLVQIASHLGTSAMFGRC